MMTTRPAPGWEAPPGHVHEPMPARDWRLVVGERRCRFTVASNTTCKARAVAELNRARLRDQNWWAYCPDHLYGRWIEDGQVWQWRVVPIGAAPVPRERVDALIAALEADISWQRDTYGDGSDKVATGRLVGMGDALRTVREYLTPTRGEA